MTEIEAAIDKERQEIITELQNYILEYKESVADHSGLVQGLEDAINIIKIRIESDKIY